MSRFGIKSGRSRKWLEAAPGTLELSSASEIKREQNREDSAASRVKLGHLRFASDPTFSEQPELNRLGETHVAE